jgi:DNA-binding NarL/FixJ family response regulator
MTRSVLIVEDDGPTRKRIAAAVAADPELVVTGEAASLTEAEDLLRAAAPDVLLVDLGLPDGSGVELIRLARSLAQGTQAMVITVLADERHVMQALEAGAQGYLLKDGSARYVRRSVQELLAGGSPISAPIARYLLRRFETARPAASEAAAGQAPRLTPRESEVLELLAKGFTYDEIGGLLSIASGTVMTHVRHIYRKLEVGSRGEAVYEAASLGLLDWRA